MSFQKYYPLLFLQLQLVVLHLLIALQIIQLVIVLWYFNNSVNNNRTYYSPEYKVKGKYVLPLDSVSKYNEQGITTT